ncbi:MAG: recombination regulator RecX [Lachnospiraceae bacterium]|nr:recombination regulator RecX [Lachnospiraceae bacterium]
MKKTLEEDDIPGAKKKALSLLKDRDYTEARLKKKLLDAGASEETACAVVLWAKECRYVDDELYCRMFIEQQCEKRSRLRIKNDLMERGISRDVAESALSAFPDNGQELKAAVSKLKSRHFRQDDTDPAYIKSTAAYLFRQGFSGEIVRAAMSLDTDDAVN